MLDEDQGIPTDSFLQCCSHLLPFFDALSPTAFAPVKADINGNIEVGFSMLVHFCVLA